MVQITMLQGRTADQKRKIAKRITDALVEEAGARREGIIVAFNEVSKESLSLIHICRELREPWFDPRGG